MANEFDPDYGCELCDGHIRDHPETAKTLEEARAEITRLTAEVESATEKGKSLCEQNGNLLLEAERLNARLMKSEKENIRIVAFLSLVKDDLTKAMDESSAHAIKELVNYALHKLYDCMTPPYPPAPEHTPADRYESDMAGMIYDELDEPVPPALIQAMEALGWRNRPEHDRKTGVVKHDQ